MTKQPADLLTWLLYHREYCGVEKFFLRVEDTPELATLLESARWCDCVVATFSHGHRDYFQQMDRQDAHIKSSLPKARAAGLDYLLHIDDDELLYCASGLDTLHDTLARAPPGAADLHVCNIEAVLPRAEVARPFEEITTFRHRPADFCAYGNGKAFGRLSAPELRPAGPHHFARGFGAAGSRGAGTHELPPSVAVVLHYESSSLGAWRRKYADLARRHSTGSMSTSTVAARAPSGYYAKSMEAMAVVTAAMTSEDAIAITKADAAARAVFEEWRLAPNGKALPTPRGATPIILRDRGLTIIDIFAQPKVCASPSALHNEPRQVTVLPPSPAPPAAAATSAALPASLVDACREAKGGDLAELLRLASGGTPSLTSEAQVEKHVESLRALGVADACGLLNLEPAGLDELLRGVMGVSLGARHRVKSAVERVRQAARGARRPGRPRTQCQRQSHDSRAHRTCTTPQSEVDIE